MWCRGSLASGVATVASVIVGGAAACRPPVRATPGPAQCNDAKVRHDLHAGQYAGIVTGSFGAPAPGCENNYALVDLCKYTSEPCGDSSGLARFANDKWAWYAFFPTTKCVSRAELTAFRHVGCTGFSRTAEVPHNRAGNVAPETAIFRRRAAHRNGITGGWHSGGWRFEVSAPARTAPAESQASSRSGESGRLIR